MSEFAYLTESELTERAFRVLERELGVVNALRFVARTIKPEPDRDSVQRHREFAAQVEDSDVFFESVMQRYTNDKRAASEEEFGVPSGDDPE